MNREIKFRAYIPEDWDDEGNTTKYKMTYNLAFEEYAPVNDQLNSVPTLMQYTGLKDKNKIDIYEGDIVERRYYHNNPPSKRPKIKFILAKLQVIFMGGQFILDDNSIRNTDYGTTFNKWWGDGCEIIGNIYENPTLVQ